MVSTARATVAGSPRKSVSPLGTTLFLASDAMIFAAFFGAYYLLRASNQPWPPASVHLDLARASLATTALLASSAALVASERAAERDNRPAALRWNMAAVALGGAFLVNQLLEYSTLSFRIATHVYGSAYWGLTGLHTLHVAAGLVALLVLGMRSSHFAETGRRDPWAWGISTYWHLVDAVWLVVFTTIWILR
ncbi:MAG: cytochrome c oxidase subunit 3 [Acidimicrobiales bacterium]